MRCLNTERCLISDLLRVELSMSQYVYTFKFPPTRTRRSNRDHTFIFLNFDTRLLSSNLLGSSGIFLLHMVAIFLLIRITLSFTSHRTLLISKWLLNHWYDFLACFYRFNFVLKYILICCVRCTLYNIYYIYAVELHLLTD